MQGIQDMNTVCASRMFYHWLANGNIVASDKNGNISVTKLTLATVRF